MIKFRKRIDFVIELSSSSVKLFDRSGINNVTYRTTIHKNDSDNMQKRERVTGPYNLRG